MSATIDPSARGVRRADEHSRWELLLLISSLVAALLFGVAAYCEIALAPWRGYQREYRAALIENAKDERTRRAAESFEVRYYQTYLPGLGRVDRCPTCHVGADDPLMNDAPQPLKTHPGTILEHHPVDRFGCTICHAGQGRATETREAHGEEPGRPAPMRRGEMLQVACALCHSEPELPGMPVYNLSRKLFHQKGCLACHVLRGTGGTLRSVAGTQGPELTAEASKHDFAWHVDHFLHPEKVVAGSKMPNFAFAEKEARALAYLMMSFTGESPSLGYLPQPTAGSGTGVQLLLARDRLGANIDPKAAPGYVGSETCLACHASLNPELPHAWQSSKMAQAFTAIANEPDREICLECHTTGFSPNTKVFAEPNVGCEACHGPGKDYVADALDGKFKDHKARAVANVLEKDRCVKCHRAAHVAKEKHVETIRAADGSPKKTAMGEPRSHHGARAYLATSVSDRSPSLKYVSLLAADGPKRAQPAATPNEFGVTIDPRAAPGYVGSESCLFCHANLDPEVAQQWRDSKKAHTFDAVRDAPDREICLPCHATGFNPHTKVFAEPNVGCEACHGPGKDYVADVMNERRGEHAERAMTSGQDKNRCVDCHQVHVPKEKHAQSIREKAAVP